MRLIYLNNLMKIALARVFSLIACLLICCGLLNACDTSGFFINDVTQNPDGTYTVDLTIEVGGFPTTGVGSTWGFWFNAQNPIISVLPPSLTSQNGTEIFAVINGTTVTWGDPVPSANPPFVDMNVDPTQQFSVTLIVASINGNWNGGGQEANNCPGGPGTSISDYEGEWPCPLPPAPTVIVPPKVCPNELINLTAMMIPPPIGPITYTWDPPGIQGQTVSVSFPNTTTINVSVENDCGSITTVPVTVDILPVPTISANDPNQEVCEGAVAYLEVTYSNPCGTPPIPTWSDGNAGNFNIVQPTSSPSTYTATVTNPCGFAETEFTVEVVPIPMLEILNDEEEAICLGDFIELEADANVEVSWSNGDIGDIIEVGPDVTTTYIATVTNSCATFTDTVTVNVFEDVEEEVQMEACTGSFVLFDGTPLDPNTVTEFTYAAFNGCDSIVTVTVDEIPTYESDVELEACANSSVFYNGMELFPGSFTQVLFTAANTCDSAVNVTVLELATYDQNITLPGCTGSTVNYNGNELSPGTTTQFMFSSFEGCDSMVTVFIEEFPTFEEDIQFETCTGTTVSYNGLQLQPGTISAFTFTALNGCDSVVNVQVIELQNIEDDLTLETCPGTTINFNGQELDPGSETEFMFVTAAGCDSVLTVTVEELPQFSQDLELEACTGSTVMYQGQELDPGTNMPFNLLAENGCDSVVNVTVLELQTFTDTLNFGTCSGTTISYNGQDLDPNTETEFMFAATNGCDSAVTVIVEELQILSSDLELQTCPNSTINYNGENFTVGADTSIFFTASNGCDSMVHLTVSALPESAETIQLQACTGTNAIYNGQSLAPGSSTAFVFPAQNGCDSTVTVNVEELDAFNSDLELQTCPGETVTYNGQDLAAGETVMVTFTSQGGCDSIVTVDVIGLNDSATPVQLETCTGTTINFDGQELDPGTVTDFVYPAFNGCDSTVTVTVMELQNFTAADQLQTCEDTPAIYHGQSLPPGSVTDVLLSAQNGCDSVVTVTVVELTDVEETVNLETCTGTTVTYNGQELPAGLVTQFVFQAQNSCDSIVTVIVDELEAFTSATQLQACPGSSVQYNGQDLPVGSVTDVMLTASNGCDSVVTVTVAELPTFSSPLQLQACPGSSVMYNGQSLLAGSVTDITLSAQNGCDSVVTVTVEELETFASPLQLQACTGSSVMYNGQDLPAGSVTDVLFMAQNGCDSIVTVTVEELDVFTSSIELQECEGVPVLFQGVEITPGTSMDFTFTSTNSCDSIVTVNALLPLPLDDTAEEITICNGESIVIFGQTVSTSGDYSQVFANQDGCDSTHTVSLTIQDAIDLSAITSSSCQDSNTGSIEISAIGGSGSYSYNWDASPNNSPTIDNLPAGNYSLTVTDDLNCTSTTQVTIDNYQLSFDASGNLDCFNGTDGIINIEATGNNLSYSLDGATFVSNPVFTNLSAGQYDVYVQDENSCVYSGLVTIENPPEVIVFFPEDELTINLGETILLEPEILVSGTPTIIWDNTISLDCIDCETPTASPTDNTTYQIVVTDEHGCTALDDITIFVRKNRDLYIPNSFSPNNDGLNDNFTIYGDPKNVISVNTFQIFTRWGEPVYTAPLDYQVNQEALGWDGTFRGEDLNTGVYVWFAEVTFLDGTTELFEGDVVLVR